MASSSSRIMDSAGEKGGVSSSVYKREAWRVRSAVMVIACGVLWCMVCIESSDESRMSRYETTGVCIPTN